MILLIIVERWMVMERIYTKEEVKGMISSGSVNFNNINDVLLSLQQYPFEEVRDILIGLSQNDNVPSVIRGELKEVVATNDTIINNNADTINEVTSEHNNNIIEDRPIELITADPDYTVTSSNDNNVSTYQELPPSTDKKGNELSDNDLLLAGITAFAVAQGITILGIEAGNKGMPGISFQLDPISNAYIDNLLLNMHPDGERTDLKGIDVSLDRVESTGQESLTIAITDKTLTPEELKNKSYEMFEKVQEILKTTDKEKNYKREMPAKLQEIKNQYHNGEPEIGDTKIVYANRNGENSYFIQGDKEEADIIANNLGYEAGEYIGGGLTEVKNVPDGAKLAEAATNVNYTDSVKADPSKDMFNSNYDPIKGVPNAKLVDIDYNNRYVARGSDAREQIDNFFDHITTDSKMDVRFTPDGQDAYIRLDDDTEKTLVIPKSEFESKVIPEAAASFSNYNVMNENGTAEAFSFDNKPNENTNENSKSNNLQYTKTLGQHPAMHPSNEEAAKVSYAPLLAFIIISIVGFLLIYVLY